MTTTLRIAHSGTVNDIGGKAAALSALSNTGLPIPQWFAVYGPSSVPDAFSAQDLNTLRTALEALAPDGRLVAVRSSAVEEDSALHSFAGQYESRLFVAPTHVPDTILALWREAISERVVAYRQQHGLTGPAPLPAMLVQRMVNADVAGVAFSADPVSGKRSTCVVAATYGLGTSIVAGDVDADTWHVQRDNTITSRTIAEKHVAHRYAHGNDTDRAAGNDAAAADHNDADSVGGQSVVEVAVNTALVNVASLTDAQIVQVAELARATAQHFGRPQDIEWAFEHGTLYLLQSRPITSLNNLADPDGELILWDNSNIVESYGGITTPLTFSFARYVYENVYREFCRMLRVSSERITNNEGALRSMLGLVRGRVYYNLISWYRILALLPGYQVNRAFMEQMMGVSDGLPAEVAAQFEHTPSRREKWNDVVAMLRTTWALARAHRGMAKSIKAFEHRLNTALATDSGPADHLTGMRPDQLVAHYRALESALLAKWDAPLVNDFFAMIFYGVLRKLTQSWCDDSNGTLQNDLVSGDGSVISAEPAKRIVQMASQIENDATFVTVLCNGTRTEVQAAIASHPTLHAQFSDYLATFGDRCLEELKLETMTLDDDPMLLAQSIGRVARAKSTANSAAAETRVDIRGDAERRALAAISYHPIRRPVFRWVLKHARHRIRDRENLRFERTRVFGRVRRIFVELGKRYHAIDQLNDPRDVFYLTVDEVLGWPGGATASSGLRALALARKAEFAQYATQPAPPDRFITRGSVHVGQFEIPMAGHPSAPTSATSSLSASDTQRTGTGCYPGVVRGSVRVVSDPRTAVLEPGEILVALRTDPGWVMLFPAASGLLVERGSLLSHSAIVARELALPAVVSIPGLTAWLHTGDVVEFDGRTGVITRLERGASA
jgi:pyruvate,water dikinase